MRRKENPAKGEEMLSLQKGGALHQRLPVEGQGKGQVKEQRKGTFILS